MFSDSIFFSEARANYHRVPNQIFVYCLWLQLKRCHCTDKLKLNWCIVSEELLFIVLVPPCFRSNDLFSNFNRSFLLSLLLNEDRKSVV